MSRLDTIGTASTSRPALAGIVVDDDGDAEALAAEALVVEERRAQVAEADQGHRPLAIEAEDALQLALRPAT
jgi:hypothetical protein